jgi:hypothetical protein
MQAGMDIDAVVQEAVKQAVNASILQDVSKPGIKLPQREADVISQTALVHRRTEEEGGSGDENTQGPGGNTESALDVPGQPSASLRLHKAQIRVCSSTDRLTTSHRCTAMQHHRSPHARLVHQHLPQHLS